MEMTPKLKSRTFWLVVGIFVASCGALHVGLLPAPLWVTVVLGNLSLWLTGKWAASKNGKTL